MQNVFYQSQYPSREPRTAAVRDRIVWRRDDLAAVYSVADYSLAYAFTSQSNPDELLEFAATEAGNAYIVEISADDSAAFAAGVWVWEAVITRTSDSQQAIVDRGYIEITDSADAGHILRVLNAIRATIEGTATEDQSRIEIGGRVLERRSISELTDLEALYSRRWKRAQAEIDRKAGRPVSRVLIKMGA